MTRTSPGRCSATYRHHPPVTRFPCTSSSGTPSAGPLAHTCISSRSVVTIDEARSPIPRVNQPAPPATNKPPAKVREPRRERASAASAVFLDEAGQVVQGHPRAGLVVGGGNAVGGLLVDDRHVGPPAGPGEHGRHRHLAAQAGVGCLELEYLGHLLVRHQPGEVAVVGISLGGRLAGRARRVIGERYPEGAPFAGIELVNPAGHAIRHPPLLDRIRIEERPVDSRAWRADMASDLCRIHVPIVGRTTPAAATGTTAPHLPRPPPAASPRTGAFTAIWHFDLDSARIAEFPSILESDSNY